MPDRTQAPPASEPGLDLDEALKKTKRHKPKSSASHSSSKRSSSSSSQAHPSTSSKSTSKIKPAPSSSASKSASKSEKTSIPASVVAKTTRVKTENAELGNPDRTMVDGMREPTELQTKYDPTVVGGETKVKDLVPASKGASYPAHTSTKSTAPSFAKSVLTNPEDIKMASRQTNFASLTPTEQTKQSAWAQTKIQLSGVCPQGFDWERTEHGYNCEGHHHLITDELLAEGRGGVLVIPGGGSKMEPRWGPYYADSKGSKKLLFGGNSSDNHPEWLDLGSGTVHWPNAWKIIPGLKRQPETSEERDRLEKALCSMWRHPMRFSDGTNGTTYVFQKCKGFRGLNSSSGLGSSSRTSLRSRSNFAGSPDPSALMSGLSSRRPGLLGPNVTEARSSLMSGLSSHRPGLLGSNLTGGPSSLMSDLNCHRSGLLGSSRHPPNSPIHDSSGSGLSSHEPKSLASLNDGSTLYKFPKSSTLDHISSSDSLPERRHPRQV